MLHREVVLPIIGERLVKGSVVLLGNVLRVAGPDRLLLVDQLPLVADFLDLLLLLAFLVLVIVNLMKRVST